MLECFFGVVIEGGLRTIGWAVLKVVTFGRYRGFKPDDLVLEGSVGVASLALVGYGVYRWFFTGMT
jgi:hypothetical protein